MTSLSRHIEALLIKHNCVVVPKLGGFVAQYTPAYYDEEEGLFVPPVRSVSFNALLAINDGLIIERYIRENNLDYASASRMVESQVDRLKEQIAETGEYELVGIGTLHSNGEYGYNFTPRPNGLMSPTLYALENTHIAPTLSLQNEEESCDGGKFDVDDNHDFDESNSKNYVLRLNRNVVNYIAAAVMAVMFYFLVMPATVTQCSDMQTASILPVKVEHHTKVQKHITVYRKHIVSKPKTAVQSETRDSLHTSTQAAPLPASEEYVVVLASAVTQKHAEEYVKKLQSSGYSSARITQKGSMRRVVMGHFPTHEDACTYIRNLNNDEQFADCWVMKV